VLQNASPAGQYDKVKRRTKTTLPIAPSPDSCVGGKPEDQKQKPQRQEGRNTLPEGLKCNCTAEMRCNCPPGTTISAQWIQSKSSHQPSSKNNQRAQKQSIIGSCQTCPVHQDQSHEQKQTDICEEETVEAAMQNPTTQKTLVTHHYAETTYHTKTGDTGITKITTIKTGDPETESVDITPLNQTLLIDYLNEYEQCYKNSHQQPNPAEKIHPENTEEAGEISYGQDIHSKRMPKDVKTLNQIKPEDPAQIPEIEDWDDSYLDMNDLRLLEGLPVNRPAYLGTLATKLIRPLTGVYVFIPVVKQNMIVTFDHPELYRPQDEEWKLKILNPFLKLWFTNQKGQIAATCPSQTGLLLIDSETREVHELQYKWMENLNMSEERIIRMPKNLKRTKCLILRYWQLLRDYTKWIEGIQSDDQDHSDQYDLTRPMSPPTNYPQDANLPTRPESPTLTQVPQNYGYKRPTANIAGNQPFYEQKFRNVPVPPGYIPKEPLGNRTPPEVSNTRENFPGTPWEQQLLDEEKQTKERDSRAKSPPTVTSTLIEVTTRLSSQEPLDLKQSTQETPYAMTLMSGANTPKIERTALDRSSSPLATPPPINLDNPDNRRDGDHELTRAQQWASTSTITLENQELTQMEKWETLTQAQLFKLLAKLTPIQVNHLIQGTKENTEKEIESYSETKEKEPCSMKEDNSNQSYHSCQEPDPLTQICTKTLTNQSNKPEETTEETDSTPISTQKRELSCPPISKHQNQLQEMKQDTLTREGDLMKQAEIIKKHIEQIQNQTVMLDQLIAETQPEGAELLESVAAMMTQDEEDLRDHQLGELENKNQHQNDGTSL
jgi:hypothetical protein